MRPFLKRMLEGQSPTAGVVVSIAAVALVTAVIAGVDRWVPVLSLGVLYLFAVLPVAVVWGLRYAIAVSVGSMLAFNFFFLEPVHTLNLRDSRNWFALLVFVVTSVVVSELATRSRRRAREAALLAEIATSLLEHGTVSEELERISAEAARALHAQRAQITLGDQDQEGLCADGRAAPGRLDPARRRVGARHGREAPPLAGPRLACSGSRSTANGWPARRSRPRRCAAPMRSIPQCSARSATTCEHP